MALRASTPQTSPRSALEDDWVGSPPVLDPSLTAIVKAAESGADCPALWLTLTSGDLVVGTPRASEVFVEGTRKVLAHVDLGFESPRKIDKRRAAASAVAEEATAHLDAKVEPSEGRAITLANTTVVRSGGNSAQIPVLRVNLDTIAAWWIVSARFKGKTGTLIGVGF
jgi:hypothetical protein